MVETVTLNIAKSNGRKFSIMTENKKFINSIVTLNKNDEITQADIDKLQQVAKKNGDAGVLECCDLSNEHKLKLAKMNNYDKYYDIKLSEDGKLFVVKIKKTGTFTKNPTLSTIKADFGINDNVFVQKGNIPYGNEDIINKRAVSGSSADGKNTDYNATKFEPGDEIKIPVALVEINGEPRGAWGRFFQ